MVELFRPLRLLLVVGLCAVMAVAFTACSDDDFSELYPTIVGVWAQNGDDDIIVIEDGGDGIWYDSPSDYKNGADTESLKWSTDGSWLKIKFEDGDTFNSRAISVAKNKIVFRDYDEDPETSDLQKDEYGYYRIWTWARFIKQ